MQIDTSLYREEWDGDSFVRKWIGTWAILSNFQKRPVLHLYDVNGKEISTNEWRPLYTRIPNGWYKTTEGFCCLTRRIKKTFCIGINETTHVYFGNPDKSKFKSPFLPGNGLVLY